MLGLTVGQITPGHVCNLAQLHAPRMELIDGQRLLINCIVSALGGCIWPISSMTDAAQFVRENELIVQKTQSATIMGGVELLDTDDGLPLVPDTANNNAFDVNAAESSCAVSKSTCPAYHSCVSGRQVPCPQISMMTGPDGSPHRPSSPDNGANQLKASGSVPLLRIRRGAWVCPAAATKMVLFYLCGSRPQSYLR